MFWNPRNSGLVQADDFTLNIADFDVREKNVCLLHAI